MDIPSDGRHVEKAELREMFFADSMFFLPLVLLGGNVQDQNLMINEECKS